MSAFTRSAFAERFRRVIAAGSALLVLALTIFAASPTAHGWLHAGDANCAGHPHGHAPARQADDDGCAIVLFAGGVALPLGPASILPPTVAPQGVSPVTAAELHLVSPRYLRQPERGPPGLG